MIDTIYDAAYTSNRIDNVKMEYRMNTPRNGKTDSRR